jgi:hypothetical protein
MTRNERIRFRYLNGETLQSIANAYGITRQRVSQLCGKRNGDLYWDKHGCTEAQLQQLRKMGRDLEADGVERERQPIGAFIRQRANAAKRSIEWKLKLWDWWTIWTESGKWSERGRGRGYVMSRYGDAGAYEVGNVFIQRADENNREYAVRRYLTTSVKMYNNNEGAA